MTSYPLRVHGRREAVLVAIGGVVLAIVMSLALMPREYVIGFLVAMPFALCVWAGVIALLMWAAYVGPVIGREVDRGVLLVGAGFGLSGLSVAVFTGSFVFIVILLVTEGHIRWGHMWKALWAPQALFWMVGGVPAILLGIAFGVWVRRSRRKGEQ